MGVLAYNMLWTIVRHHQEEAVLYSIAIALGNESESGSFSTGTL